MRLFLLFLAMAGCRVVTAQAPSLHLQYCWELASNEQDFVIESQVKGLRYGFLRYMQPGTIGLNQKGISNLYQEWSNRGATNFQLVWKPTIAFATANGRSGFTAGPYFTGAPADSILTKGGYFFSVWEKNEKDSFRLRFDTGIPHRRETERDGHLAFIPPVSSVTGQKAGASFALFQQGAAQSLQRALLSLGSSHQELLVSNIGEIRGNEIEKESWLNAPVSCKEQQRFQSNGLTVVMGTVSFPKDHFPPDRKLASEGYFVQVWSDAKEGQQIIATLIKL